jgi:hypothetical protein
MCKIEMNPEFFQEALETISLAKILHYNCRCIVKMKDFSEFKGAKIGYWKILHFDGRHYLNYIRRPENETDRTYGTNDRGQTTDDRGQKDGGI